jgi:hypothetical protein
MIGTHCFLLNTYFIQFSYRMILPFEEIVNESFTIRIFTVSAVFFHVVRDP